MRWDTEKEVRFIQTLKDKATVFGYLEGLAKRRTMGGLHYSTLRDAAKRRLKLLNQ